MPTRDAAGRPFAPLRYATFCSGVEGVSVAWEVLGGFEPVFFSEVDPFACAVLAHRWPWISNLGDLTKIDGAMWRGAVDVVWGSTPCQAFSFAGTRAGTADPRGALTAAFAKRCAEIDPTYVLWENVKGVLSDPTNGFGCLLGALAGEDGPLQPPGGKWAHAGYVLGPKRTIAWRLFDAQHGGVPQRRERVFLVGSARDGADPRDLLFEREGLRRDLPPSRPPAAGLAAAVAGGLAECVCAADLTNGLGGDVFPTLDAGMDSGNRGCGVAIAYGIRSDAQRDGVARTPSADAEGRVRLRNAGMGVYADLAPTLDAGQPHSVAYAIQERAVCENVAAGPDGAGFRPNVAYTLEARLTTQMVAYADQVVAVAPPEVVALAAAHRGRDGGGSIELGDEVANALRTPGGGGSYALALIIQWADQILARVRRLTPLECERLQGLPDRHTLIPYRGKPAQLCPDGPRYKAIGNGLAIPDVRWLGARLLRFHRLKLLEPRP